MESNLSKLPVTIENATPAIHDPRPRLPTPLYVTQQDKSVKLRFNTQAEADLAWRYLSALAEVHADRVHAEQEEQEHERQNLLPNRTIES